MEGISSNNYYNRIQPMQNNITYTHNNMITYYCINCHTVHPCIRETDSYYKKGYWVCKASEDRKRMGY